MCALSGHDVRLARLEGRYKSHLVDINYRQSVGVVNGLDSRTPCRDAVIYARAATNGYAVLLERSV